ARSQAERTGCSSPLWLRPTWLKRGREEEIAPAGDAPTRPPAAVIRSPWTATVHAVLRHLEDVGFDGAPRARGFDDQGRERLTFLPGQTLGDTLGETGPWPDWLRCDDTLQQVGTWLRR